MSWRRSKIRGVRWAWLLSCGAYAIAILVIYQSAQGVPKGSRFVERLTLVSSDREALACALSAPTAGLHCEYARDDGHLVPSKKTSSTLAPYLSLHRRLYLIPGLFDAPGFPADGKRSDVGTPTGEERRFIAIGDLELLGEVDSVRVRWSQHGSWRRAGPALVAS